MVLQPTRHYFLNINAIWEQRMCLRERPLNILYPRPFGTLTTNGEFVPVAAEPYLDCLLGLLTDHSSSI